MNHLRQLAVTALVGLVSGVFLLLLTNLISHSDISGPGWSLKGNGALIIPFGVGPAVLAAGWVALVRRAKGETHWLTRATLYGLVGLVPAILSLLSLALLGGNAGTIYLILGLAPWLWAVTAPILAGRTRSGTGKVGWGTVVAGLIFLLSLAGGFMLTEIVIPT